MVFNILIKLFSASKRLMSGHRTFPLAPSRFQYIKFKDHFHYYLMLGIIPCTLAIFLANVFIGPSTLSEIPKDYTPKEWEYFRVCLKKNT